MYLNQIIKVLQTPTPKILLCCILTAPTLFGKERDGDPVTTCHSYEVSTTPYVLNNPSYASNREDEIPKACMMSPEVESVYKQLVTKNMTLKQQLELRRVLEELPLYHLVPKFANLVKASEPKPTDAVGRLLIICTLKDLPIHRLLEDDFEESFNLLLWRQNDVFDRMAILTALSKVSRIDLVDFRLCIHEFLKGNQQFYFRNTNNRISITAALADIQPGNRKFVVPVANKLITEEMTYDECSAIIKALGELPCSHFDVNNDHSGLEKLMTGVINGFEIQRIIRAYATIPKHSLSMNFINALMKLIDYESYSGIRPKIIRA
ncbi:MAG: hypothetical protein Q8K36_00965, partial [Alphaproteobacteria bacterium]|nr:hypothetical protein [Alphaproteobacteria bacterium]